MDGKKLITICQFGGEFESNKDGILTYNGGEAHAIDIDHETKYEDFRNEIAEMVNCNSALVSIEYFLAGNRKTLITVSNDKDLKRMISFNVDSTTVDVYVTAGEVAAHDHSNMPASRSSRTMLSEAVVPFDITLDAQDDNVDHTQNDCVVDVSLDMQVDSAPEASKVS
ncbi:hypothetical protein ACHQM5_007579 [Ranunculus cassubicifolius]